MTHSTSPRANSPVSEASTPGLVNLGETPEYLSARTKAEGLLRHYYGHTAFRPGQLQAIDAAFKGRDLLINAPTSWGKSLVYQIPAIKAHLDGKGITIVVSPLIALIRDQVSGLRAKGIEVAFFDSIQTKVERDFELAKITSGRAALVYVAPERFVSRAFQERVLGLSNGRSGSDTPRLRIPIVAIDETHAIPQWGHDFRMAYGPKLGAVIVKLGRPQVIACSATLTAAARDDVISVLGLAGHYEANLEIDRPNLKYSVKHFESKLDKWRYLVGQLQSSRRESGTGMPESSIIYCASRRGTEETAEYLRRRGIPAVFYHAGMEREDRLASQSHWMSDIAPVMVATKAFGMGIDKPNVRRVYHLDVPGSLEDYAQESGRAGRDGRPATCELLYQPEDIYLQIHFISGSNPTREYIERTYKLLWSWLKESQKRTNVPKLRINFDKFLPDEGEYKHLSSLRRAALTCLVERGIIDIDGWTILFRIKPTEVDALLPTDQQVVEKRSRASQALKIMCYFANQMGGDESLRTTITEHFRHNGIVERVSKQDLRELIAIDQLRVAAVIRAVNWGDASMSDMISLLKGAKRSRGTGAEKGALRGLTSSEIRSVIKHAAWCGYIRLHRRAKATSLSLTTSGIGYLRRELPPSEHGSLDGSKSLGAVMRRLCHAAERQTTREAIKPWYQENAKPVRSAAEWRRALDNFLESKFKICDETVSGSELVRQFHWNRADPGRREARAFLNFFFKDPLDLLADKRALKK